MQLFRKNCTVPKKFFLSHLLFYYNSFTAILLLKNGFKNRIRSKYFDFTIREALTDLKDIHVFW